MVTAKATARTTVDTTSQTKIQNLGVYGVDSEGVTTITYTRSLNHPIETVWQFITVGDQRKCWFPELELSASLGGEAVVNFSGTDCPPLEENPSDVYVCRITGFEPPRLLEFSGPGEHHRYELSEKPSGCELKFTAVLPDRTAFDDPSKTIQSRYSVACGWHYKLDELQWSLDRVPFEDEGYAGPIKTQYYLAYLRLDETNQNH